MKRMYNVTIFYVAAVPALLLLCAYIAIAWVCHTIHDAALAIIGSPQ